MVVNIISLNVRGLRDENKRRAVGFSCETCYIDSVVKNNRLYL